MPHRISNEVLHLGRRLHDFLTQSRTTIQQGDHILKILAEMNVFYASIIEGFQLRRKEAGRREDKNVQFVGYGHRTGEVKTEFQHSAGRKDHREPHGQNIHLDLVAVKEAKPPLSDRRIGPHVNSTLPEPFLEPQPFSVGQDIHRHIHVHREARRRSTGIVQPERQYACSGKDESSLGEGGESSRDADQVSGRWHIRERRPIS